MLKISFEREINADIVKAFDIISNFENFQKKLKINEKDDASLIEKRIHNLEYEFYPKVIASLLET